MSTGAIAFFWFRSLRQSGAQPCGQVFCSAVGVKQTGARDSGPCSSQQSWPTPQHMLPQQVAVPMQTVPAAHGGRAQVPLSQNGVAGSQTLSHLPQ